MNNAKNNTNSNDNSNLIDSAAIGVEVSWDFGVYDALAVRVPRDEMRARLTRLGFDPKLISHLTASEALARAVRVAKGRTKAMTIHEMKRHNRDTRKCFGIYYISAVEGEKGDKVVCGSRVRVENDIVVCREPEGADGEEECMAFGQQVADTANMIMSDAVNGDLSEMLLTIGRNLGWISRRNHGGVYYLNNDHRAESFVRLLNEVQSTTASRPRAERFVAQPTEVYPKPLSLNTWSAAARTQFTDDTAKLLADLQSMQQDGKMRDSTVAKRAAECDALIAHAETHAGLLADQLDAIKAQLTRIRDGFQGKLSAVAGEAEAVFGDDLVDAKRAAPKRTRKARRKAPAKASKPVAKSAAPTPTGEALFDL